MGNVTIVGFGVIVSGSNDVIGGVTRRTKERTENKTNNYQRIVLCGLNTNVKTPSP